MLNEPDPAKAIPSALRQTVDAIRNFSNFSAHSITDQTTLQVIEVEPGEAEWCLDILEEMFDHYYVKPAQAAARKAALNVKLAAAGNRFGNEHSFKRDHHRSPVTTISISWLAQREQTSRLRQSGTVVSGPYRLAISVGSGSTRWRQSRHHTISRTPASAAPPSVIGGPGWDFI